MFDASKIKTTALLVAAGMFAAIWVFSSEHTLGIRISVAVLGSAGGLVAGAMMALVVFGDEADDTDHSSA